MEKLKQHTLSENLFNVNKEHEQVSCIKEPLYINILVSKL